MKNLGILIVLLAFYMIFNFTRASSSPVTENTLPENYVYQPPASNMPPETINGVDVPYEILIYAQMAYQGYAVTQAKVTSWNGEKAFQLRIDNDSNPNDTNGMYLIYDKEWKLVSEKAIYAPLPDNRIEEVQPPPTVTEPVSVEVNETETEASEPDPAEEEPEPEITPEEPGPEVPVSDNNKPDRRSD